MIILRACDTFLWSAEKKCQFSQNKKEKMYIIFLYLCQVPGLLIVIDLSILSEY